MLNNIPDLVVDMQKMILTGHSGETVPGWTMDKNPKPFTTIKPKDEDDQRYVSLSGGVFQEVFEPKRLEHYRSFVFDTETRKITAIDISNREHFVIDPVAFAYDFGARAYDARLGRFKSTDPMAHRQPGWSPYKALLNNPVLFVDPLGETEYITVKVNDERTGKTTAIRTATSSEIMTDGVTTQMKYGQDMQVKENHYYDFERITTINIDKNGKSTMSESVRIMKENGIKDSDYAWFGGNEAGDTKTDYGSLNLKGGMFLVSKDGGTGTGFTSLSEAQMLEVSDLITTIGAMGYTAELGNKAAEMIKDASGLVDKSLEVMEVVQKRTGVLNSNPQQLYKCPTCGGNFHTSDTSTHNEKNNRTKAPDGGYTPVENE